MKITITDIVCILACVLIGACSSLQPIAAAVVTDAPTIISQLQAAGVLGPKGTADANAAGWALQLLVNKQAGGSITAADLTTGIQQVDNVVAANVSPGKLNSSGAGKLLTVANALINGQ